MLKDEETDKEVGRKNHEDETDAHFQENQKKATDLKTKLFTFTESQED